jgi:hypothetical protein
MKKCGDGCPFWKWKSGTMECSIEDLPWGCAGIHGCSISKGSEGDGCMVISLIHACHRQRDRARKAEQEINQILPLAIRGWGVI